MKFYMSSKVQCSFIIEDHLCELGKRFLKLERGKERERGRVTPNMEEIAKNVRWATCWGCAAPPLERIFFGAGAPKGPLRRKAVLAGLVSLI